MGVPTLGTFLLTSLSIVYGARTANNASFKAAQARRAALLAAGAAKALEVRPTLSGVAIPYTYGISLLPGVRSFHDTYHDQDASPFRPTIQGEDLKTRIYANNQDDPTNVAAFLTLPNDNYMIVDRETMPVIPVGTRSCKRVFRHSSPNGNDQYDWVCSGDEIPINFNVWDSRGTQYSIRSASISKRQGTNPIGYNFITGNFDETEIITYYIVEFVGGKPPAGTTLYRDFIEPPVFVTGSLSSRRTLSSTSSSYAYSSLGTNYLREDTQVGTILVDRIGFRYVVTGLNSRRVTFRMSPDAGNPTDRDLYFLSTSTTLPRTAGDLADRPGQLVAPQDSRWAIDDPAGQDGKNQFLMVQNVLCLGAIDLIDLTIDDNASDSKQYKGTFNSFINPYNQVSLYADVETDDQRDIVFGDDLRIATAPLYTGMSYSTSTFKKSLDADKALVYTGIPRMSFFTSTLGVRGSDSNRIDRVLRDLLTSGEHHEPFFPPEQVDLQIFQSSQERITPSDGELNVFSPYFFENDVNDWLWMFNGTVPSDLPVADMIDLVLSGQPGLIIFKDINGVFKASNPDRVSTQVTLGEEDIIQGTLIEVSPSSQDRLNTYTINFPNAKRDMAADSVTYSSPTYIAQDGGLILDDEQAPAGIVYKEQAMRMARFHVNRSRRTQYEVTLRPKWLILEPGDVFTLEGVGDIRVESIRTTPETNVIVTGLAFKTSDWKRDDPDLA